MPLSDVLHQESAQKRLQRALASGRVPHAYLFSGPPGVGKEMLASRFAARLLCASPVEIASLDGGAESWTDACGACTDCTLLAAGNHPDFHRIYRRLNRFHPDTKVQKRKALDLSVDVVRHFVINEIAKRPSRGRAKVFVVVEAERMSAQAQNALLKTLEEPPGPGYLILLAASPDALLPTTRSRCQHISFRGLPLDFVVAQVLERHGASPEAARFLAELCQGSLGPAGRYVEAKVFERVPPVLEAIGSAARDPLGCGKALAELAKGLSEDLEERTVVETVEEDVEEEDEEEVMVDADANVARQARLLVIAMTATILRDIQRVAVGYEPAALPDEGVIRELAAGVDPRSMIAAIRAAGTAEYQIGRNAHTGLVFDSLGIALGNGLKRMAVASRA
ncbi:MAG TPA: DNA polymerase III subunit delta' [Phycisphaerae bacterium]|nr:DNA polymerase III subunit delta' [Phycisphaerae bacterium]